MAQGQYKISEIIEVTYQATGAASGLTDITMEIYDETGVKDIPNFPDVIMTEIVSTGRYKGSFAPDVEGKWRVMINSSSKKGIMVKDFDVVGHNVDAIGDAVADVNADVAAVGGLVVTIDGKADVIKAKTDSLPADPASESAIRGTDGDTLKDLSDQLDNIASLDSPPMIG